GIYGPRRQNRASLGESGGCSRLRLTAPDGPQGLTRGLTQLSCLRRHRWEVDDPPCPVAYWADGQAKSGQNDRYDFSALPVRQDGVGLVCKHAVGGWARDR